MTRAITAIVLAVALLGSVAAQAAWHAEKRIRLVESWNSDDSILAYSASGALSDTLVVTDSMTKETHDRFVRSVLDDRQLMGKIHKAGFRNVVFKRIVAPELAPRIEPLQKPGGPVHVAGLGCTGDPAEWLWQVQHGNVTIQMPCR